MIFVVKAVLPLVAASVLLLVGREALVVATTAHQAASRHATASTPRSPAPTGSMSAYEAGLFAWIDAIVADARSGRYFSNDFEDSYSAGAESALVQGMALGPVGEKPSDEMLSCMLSYFESTVRAHDAFPRLQRLRSKATANCLKLDVT